MAKVFCRQADTETDKQGKNYKALILSMQGHKNQGQVGFTNLLRYNSKLVW